jgi:hypothetical protein
MSYRANLIGSYKTIVSNSWSKLNFVDYRNNIVPLMKLLTWTEEQKAQIQNLIDSGCGRGILIVFATSPAFIKSNMSARITEEMKIGKADLIAIFKKFIEKYDWKEPADFDRMIDLLKSETTSTDNKDCASCKDFYQSICKAAKEEAINLFLNSKKSMENDIKKKLKYQTHNTDEKESCDNKKDT